MKKRPGITREEEEEKLKRTLKVARDKVEANIRNVKALEEELHAMQEEFDESDKEMQTLWHDADARFKFVNQDLRRAKQAQKKPYFGRIDFRDSKLKKDEVYYIGRSVIADNPAEPEVIDWRAPIAGVYYDAALGKATYSVRGEGNYEIELSRKRTYEIEDEKLKDFYDSDVVANDELLTKYLAKNKRSVLGEIIATIQKEQNEVIRKKPQHNLIVQGAAGSGKTTVAMHRISYILYNYELEFAPEDFYIIGSNQVLLNYITGVLPDLNVYGVSQMTMEQLFVRLLYEDWDKSFRIKPVIRGVTPPIKGTYEWFHDLEQYCVAYEDRVIPKQDVVIEKNGVILLKAAQIEKILEESRNLSRADKISRLTEYLISKLENEISGKYYSYTAGEKQRLLHKYETYFGKREWKGSIFDLYDDFLTGQNAKGYQVDFPGKEFDVYDLAALAYLYKRIKEDQVIREAGHVVIDEAQDFGMMVYGSLKYCLSKCTYTIMGDVSQNISLDYGLNDWSKLRELMLPGEYDYFGLLRKSYRNTVEIAEFATDILCHGSFSIYPIEPIIRHGREVEVLACDDFSGLIRKSADIIENWQKSGMETIAVVCADEHEAASVSEQLRVLGIAVENVMEEQCFEEGVMVLSLEYTKGLEFDAVLLFDASAKNYPAEDGYVKRLYVAATRALHELVVLYQGELTPLIASPVSEERKKKLFALEEGSRKTPKPVVEERTREEILREIAEEGEKERLRRGTYGPRAISVKSASVPEQRTEGIPAREPAIVTAPQKKKSWEEQNRDVTIPSYLERRKQELKQQTQQIDSGEFGEAPDQNSLRPVGHPRIDTGVRFSMKGKGYYDVFSNYGTLRITPMSQDVIRICFAKGQCSVFPEALSEMKGAGGKYKIRESVSAIEILTDKVLVKVEKKTGALSFLTPQGKLLLAERGTEPRQVSPDQVWEFFAWKKEEALLAEGISEERILQIGSLARYISFGEKSGKSPRLASAGKYELVFPPRQKTLCCNIPMYGPYVSQEGTGIIDYYFVAK